MYYMSFIGLRNLYFDTATDFYAFYVQVCTWRHVKVGKPQKSNDVSRYEF